MLARTVRVWGALLALLCSCHLLGSNAQEDIRVCLGSGCPSDPCSNATALWVESCPGGCDVSATSRYGVTNTSCPDNPCRMFVDCRFAELRVHCWDEGADVYDTVNFVEGFIGASWYCRDNITQCEVCGNTGACCPEGQVCVSEACCPADMACGTVCCSEGTVCVNNACGKLGTGDIQVSLRWNTIDDVDLHVIDPQGSECYYSQKIIPSGGQLDADANAGCSTTSLNPVENIFWEQSSNPPHGTYTVRVVLYKWCAAGSLPVDFSLRTLVAGVETNYAGTVSSTSQPVDYTFTYPPNSM